MLFIAYIQIKYYLNYFWLHMVRKNEPVRGAILFIFQF